MKIRSLSTAFVAITAMGLVGAFPGDASGQDGVVLEVGQAAPDFEIVGSTDTGILGEPIRLSDFRGKTVVLAFFYRVRTPG